MPRRSRPERERDLLQVADWYCKGITQAVIGQRLGLTQQQISYDIKKLIARWQAASKALLDELKAAEIGKINHLERVAWECFEDSREPKLIEIERITDAARRAQGKGGRGKPSAVKLIPTFLETRTERGPGDPQWLRLVQWCIDTRCKILGIYAPTKVAPVMPDGDEPYEPISDTARGAALMAALGQISADSDHSPEPEGDQSQAEV